MPQNSIEAQTAREAAAANCDSKGKCVKDPSGLVLYNSDLVTENFVLKRPDQNPTLLTRIMNLVNEPKLLVTADKLEPLIRGVAIVGEFEPCDSPKGIDGVNPTVGQLRSLKQGRYKACITYIGDGLFKRAYALSPIDVDTTPPEVAKIGVTHTAVTPTTAGLAWSKAGDNLTLDGKLVYSVYTSKTNVLDSLEAVRTRGNLVPGLLIGGMSYTITSLTESTNYHAAVVVTDEAGNQSLVGHTNFQTTASDTNPSDTNPPTSPSVVININDSYTNTTAVTLTLSAGEASEMYVTNTEGCTSGGTWQPYVTSKSWTLAQTNATATAYAKFRDLAGNETGCVNDTIIHDDIAPTAPNVAGATFTNDTTPSWSWTSGGGGNGTYRYKLNNADLTTGSTETTSATFTPSSDLSEGAHTLYVQERDAAGNWSESGSHAIDVDTTLPTLTISDASDNFINTSNKTSYSGLTGTCSTADGSVTVAYVKTPSAPVVWNAACTSGNWTAGAIDISSFSDGIVTITATQTDSVGNVGTASTSTIKDTIAPTAPNVAGATPTNDTTPSWSWTSAGDGNGTYRYKLNNADLTAGATETTSATFTPSADLSEGAHTLYVQERDAAGNWSESGIRAIGIDVTPPNVPTVTGTTPTGNATPTWSWSSGGNGGNGTYRYKLNDTNLSSGATETASTNFTSGSVLPEATHTLYVQERDAAGNWSASGSFAIQVVTPPAVPTLLTPTRGLSSLELSWAGVPGATSYNLYWSTTAGVSTASTKISDVTSTYIHSSLTDGQTYYYRLAATKDGVEGDLSNEVSGTPDLLPASPTNVVGTPENLLVNLSWDEPADNGGTPVVDYVIQYSSDGGSSWTTFSDGLSTVKNSAITSLTNGTSYLFRVAATNSAGTGLYSMLSASVTPAFTCPANYVKVQANATLGTSEFCVAKYEMKNNGSNVAVSQAAGVPWADITRDGGSGAIAKCQALSTGRWTYDLISNSQWQALAREIETAQNPVGTYLNWSNNSTSGSNYLNRGHSDGNPGLSLAASSDNDPCSGTGQTSCATNSNANFTQKRTHTLKSGEIVWDVAGNVWEWVKDTNNIARAPDGYVSVADTWDTTDYLNYGSEGTYTPKDSGEHGGLGHGWLNYSGGAVLRGGNFNPDDRAGIFTTDLTIAGTFTGSSVGFRCVLSAQNAAASPFFNQIGGAYDSAQTVSITSATAGSSIYFTIDGSTPTTSSTPYTAAISVSSSQTIKAIAVKSSLADSPVTSVSYVIDTVAPVITAASVTTPSPGTTLTPSVTFTSNETGTYQLFSVAGCGSGSVSAGTAMLAASNSTSTTSLAANVATSIYVKATDSVGNSSCTTVGTYTHDNTAPLTPVIADSSKAFNASFATTIAQNSPPDVNFKEFRYTTDGVDPTCSTGAASATQPTSVVIVPATTTLKVIACDLAGLASSVVATSVFTYDVTPPNVPTVTGTTPTANTTPTWSWSSGGNGGNGTYRYKLNDTNLSTGATETTGTSFNPGTALSEATHTLYVQERDAAGNWSTSGSFAIQVVTPPAAPTLSTPTRYVTSLGLSWASVAGATSYNLYWSTTSGVTTSSTKISGVTSVYTHSSLSAGAPYYYKLAAVKNGVEGALSNEVSGTPFVGQAAAPIMSPAAGTYASTQTVTLTSSTIGAAIYYRLDGVAASCSSGTPYTGSITVTSTTTISAIACASDHQDSTLSSGTFTIEAITADNGYGRFFGWGFNSDGRLGNGTTSAITSPSQIGSDSDWTALVHSMYHSAGIRLGKLYTWGRNVEGQLGNGTTTNSLSPVEILPPSVLPNIDNRWTHVSVGWYHTVAIRGGKLYAWGENVCGQLGDGTTTRRNIPVQIGTDNDWTHVSAGGHVTVGIRGGKLYGWGDTTHGVIGNNATAANCILYDETVPIHRSPTQIGADSDWTHVSTSGTHTLGIRNNGRLYALGYNEYGKLGDGTSVNKNTLTQIGTASDWTSVSTGRIHTVGLRSGVVFAWGSNWYGQLGTGGPSNSFSAFVTTPQQIGTENTWSMVSAADDHTMAIRGGSLYGWGANHNRQLGDGTTTQRNTPTLIGSSTDWIYIWAGGSVSLGIQKPAAGFVASCAGDCYMEGSAPGYAQSLPVGTERLGPAGVTMSLQHANGSSGFKIWKEKSGSRILNAAGITSNGWQQGLTRTGTSFASTDFTIGANIAGRVCPTNVFINYSVMTAANRCLYYDAGNSMQALDGAGTAGVEATDWLQNWNSSATGRGAGSSYYEGNIKTCADKGMRLPTLYETTADPSASTNLPTSDGISPIWSVSTGVPHFDTSGSWTASGNLGDSTRYFRWRGTGISFDNFGVYSNTDRTVRCVLPSSIPACAGDCYNEGSAPNYAQDFPIGTERVGPSGSTLTLQFAIGSSGFKIWKEKGGSRILNATGLVTNGWQKQLTRAGTAFSATDFTTGSNIAGRACPTHVFLSHTNMTATNRCIYYDPVTAAFQTLNAVAGIEAEDWLARWDRPLTGRGATASWYEGNIKTCADKGMRLPTLYETNAPAPSSGGPTDASPIFGGTRVPHFYLANYYVAWTASAQANWNIEYWQWSDGMNSSDNFDDTDYGPYQVRCVLP